MTACVIIFVGVLVTLASAFSITPFVDRDDRGIASLVGALIVMPLVGIAAMFLGTFIIGATDGFLPDYSEGSRTGYVTKLSRLGFYWKTNEGELQPGVGEMASLQPAFAFSVVDPDVLRELESVQGTSQRVRLQYKQWYFQPYWRGDSGYEIVAVERIGDGTH